MPLSRGGGGGQRGPPRKFKRQGRQAQAAAPAPGSQLEVAGVEGLEEKAADLSIVEEVSVQPEEVGAAAATAAEEEEEEDEEEEDEDEEEEEQEQEKQRHQQTLGEDVL